MKRRLLPAIVLGILWYFEVYGSGQARTILNEPAPGIVTTPFAATIGPFNERADCERYRVFYQDGDVNYVGGLGTLGCRIVVTP